MAKTEALRMAEEYARNIGLEIEKCPDLTEYILNNTLEEEYIINERGYFDGCIMTITAGGPHCDIFLHYNRAWVVCTWNSPAATYSLSNEIADKLYEITYEMFQQWNPYF